MENTIEQTPVEISSEGIHLYPDSRDIYYPHFIDEARTRLKAIIRNNDGSLSEMEVDAREKNHVLMRDTMAQYQLGEIEMNTYRENVMRAKREERAQRVNEDRLLNDEREQIFQAKAKALEIAEVKACPDKALVRRIRRAKSVIEVQGWVAVVLQTAWLTKAPETPAAVVVEL